MQKFETLRQPLLGFWTTVSRTRNQEKDYLPKIVATYVYASSQGQRTHSARTKILFLSSYFLPYMVSKDPLKLYIERKCMD